MAMTANLATYVETDPSSGHAGEGVCAECLAAYHGPAGYPAWTGAPAPCWSCEEMLLEDEWRRAEEEARGAAEDAAEEDGRRLGRTCAQAEELASVHVPTAQSWADEGRDLPEDFSLGLDPEECVYAGRSPTHGVGVTVGYWRHGPPPAGSAGRDAWEPDGWVTVYGEATRG